MDIKLAPKSQLIWAPIPNLCAISSSAPFSKLSQFHSVKTASRRVSCGVAKCSMAWWEGVAETRVLIAPEPSTNGNKVGQLLSLRHPKSGNATCYFCVDGALQELHWFKQSYGSWFLGDYVCEDGRLYAATPVDPVFVLLPIFEEARMKKKDDAGKFRQLDEITYVAGYPGYQHLDSVAEKCMQVVCDVKDIGSMKFFRLNDEKVLKWLCYKVIQLKKTLLTLDVNYAAQDKRGTLADAVSIIGEYLKEEPWLKILCSKLSIDLQEDIIKTSNPEIHSSPPENGLESFKHEEGKSTGVQEKSTSSKRQTKKAKVETNSKNIKDMFSRATRSRR